MLAGITLARPVSFTPTTIAACHAMTSLTLDPDRNFACVLRKFYAFIS